MKNYFLLLVFSFAILFCTAQKEDQQPYLTKLLNTVSIKNVEAASSGGNITVTGVAQSEAKIEVYVSDNNDKNLSRDEIKQRLEELYNLDVSFSGNKLNAIVREKHEIKDWKKALNISFKIFVPQNVSTELSTSGGNIVLSNLSGNQKFSTSGGNLKLDKLSGKLNGRTSGGSITLENSKDDIDLTTSGGNIKANNCTGNLKLTTSGGTLDLTSLNGTINAHTSGGNVRGKNIDGELSAHTSGGNVNLTELGCSLESSTSGGNMTVAFTKLGKYVKLNNTGGNIDLTVPKNKGLDLDLSGTIATTHFDNFSGTIDENKVKGKLNGGGVAVTADAKSGRISIELK
jgi:hypothetical protein